MEKSSWSLLDVSFILLLLLVWLEWIVDLMFGRYVLWTNEDNERLARDYFSEYYYAYNNLPREIYRVDMVSLGFRSNCCLGDTKFHTVG